MRIKSVRANSRRRAFEVETPRGSMAFPYAKADLRPSPENPVTDVFVDEELGSEAFTYTLASGQEGSIHIERVLDYNRDPAFVRDMLLYKLTVQAQALVESSELSKREIMRRLRTSPAQFYRLLDTTDYSKSIDKVLELLGVLDYDIEFVPVARESAPVEYGSRSARAGALSQKTVSYSRTGIETVPVDKPIMFAIKTARGRTNYVGVARRGKGRERLLERLSAGDTPGVSVHIEQFGSIADARARQARLIARSKPKYNKQEG